jgi:hypothetical protein
MASFGNVEIRRRRQLVGLVGSFVPYIDGEPAGKLRPGGTLLFTLANGWHEIWIANSAHVQFEVQAGGRVSLLVSFALPSLRAQIGGASTGIQIRQVF